MSKLNDALRQLNPPIETCKVCFNPIPCNSLRTLFNEVEECNDCFNKKEPQFIKFKVDGIDALAIYYYDTVIRGLIYQLKGCFDIELARSFLETFAFELRAMYFNRYIVYAPSYEKDNETRGFNHVEEIFKILKLKPLDILRKTQHHKQSDQSLKNREDIKKYLKVEYNGDLRGKNILLVDDIYTTGSTMKACINLLKSLHPKSIKILVLCKTKDLDDRD